MLPASGFCFLLHQQDDKIQHPIINNQILKLALKRKNLMLLDQTHNLQLAKNQHQICAKNYFLVLFA